MQYKLFRKEANMQNLANTTVATNPIQTIWKHKKNMSIAIYLVGFNQTRSFIASPILNALHIDIPHQFKSITSRTLSQRLVLAHTLSVTLVEC